MQYLISLWLSAFAQLLAGDSRWCVLAAESVPLAARGAPSVDLGYAIYQGSYDANNSVNIFKGIRYAAAPLGNRRWTAPQAPETNRSFAILADTDPPICPQTGASSETPAEYGFVSGPGNEDCLFLNVFAPADVADLPVFFWIHGGGYGLFSATGLDPTDFMASNNNTFVSIVIQYRLGAFGFLSGGEVGANGTLNAGLLDMNFALQWVQEHVSKFGGDPTRVTLAGESAGAAAVVYQAMAYGGQNDSLFENIISASPWVPNQYNYDDPIPTQSYDQFVAAAGCAAATDRLQCLRDTDSTVLQNASAKVSESGPFGTFAFLPVTDGVFLQNRLTEQVLSKALAGKRVLTGNMANEGVPLSPPNANTLDAFRDYVNITFPHFSDTDKADLEARYAYARDFQDTNASNPLFETSGTFGPSAVNQSSFATGQQQRGFDVFAEYAFVCPSYWLAAAYHEGWKYQFSVSPAYHGFDLTAYWSKNAEVPGKDFIHAFHKVWGNFITQNSPVITVEDAKGSKANATVPEGEQGNIDWPIWTESKPIMLSLNSTGGVPSFRNVTDNLQYYVYLEPGVTNEFKLANGRSWEAGRGDRCDWWLAQASRAPY
ncbi:alpha/beta-hydrolase [Lophiostoma macrostomum CBS 122681]|uniref:Carboxylic ester hydrolase n=1 Tax=Lophiostoma macrostomum CBS 122681 TaxID=1314788 RepID=A0A6A6TNK1_9PLEO|nr:alpha/beta-hydrolase [Lophiostoma macrostomum CBS 122681]